MTKREISLLLCLLLVVAVHAVGDDEEKADKQIRKISAMSVDVTARSIVNRSMAEMLKVDRAQLVRERWAMNLNYGSVFLAHQIAASGVKMLDIALQLQEGRSLTQIAEQQHVNWKQVAAEAKKLNGAIEDGIYNHFLHGQEDERRDQVEKYNAALDLVKADAHVQPEDIQQAQNTYVFWRTRAGEIQPKGGRLSTSEEMAAYQDHARAGTPTQGASGSHVPAAGGPRQY